MVEKIQKKNIIKLPNLVLERVGLHQGDYVEVTDDGYKIIITPKNHEDVFSENEWDKLKKLSQQKKGKAHKNGQAFLKHLDKLSKK